MTLLSFTAPGQRFAIPPVPVKRFTVGEYHRLIAKGAFDEDDPVELLEGWITPKMPRNPPHDSSVTRVQRQLWTRLAERWVIRSQCAVTLSDSEPEPDLAVAIGPPERYDDHHPGAEELHLVIEISASSIGSDRDFKLQIYGKANIPEYWIVDVGARRVEVYTDPTGAIAEPTYRTSVTYGIDDSIAMSRFGPQVAAVAVRDLIPATKQAQ